MGGPAPALDLTSNLKVGADDRESLRFITWLRREMGSAEAIESVLVVT